jgi:catechol 2,3-dioxygenase-like lactoylglutathione lyase family enzyme
MVDLKNMQVTLSARDVKEAARFYTEVLGFRILNEGSSHVTLAQGDLRLSLIRAEPGMTAGAQPAQLRFIVDAPEQVDELAARANQLDIPVLEEVAQQPDGTRAFTCLGPDEQLIEIGYEPAPPVPAEPVAAIAPPIKPVAEIQSSPPTEAMVENKLQPPTEALAESKPPPSATRPSAPRSQPPVQPPAAPPGRPTRSDRYLLEAQERLAKIKEELASLSTSFSQTDIAGTLDEMRQKVAHRVGQATEKMATPTDPEADRERKRREAEEALARYKQVVAQERLEPAKPEEEGLKPVRKTLGPATDDKPPRE